MSDVEFSGRMARADRWSKVLALLVAMGVFLGSNWLLDAPQFSSITAAFAGIGARFLIPYRVSLSIPPDQRTSIEEHPMAGSFHHGAVGGALSVGSLVTTGLAAAVLDSTPSLVMGALFTAMAYIALEELLPRG
ncbi:MAG: hypothetical protein J07HX64_01178 [halophilic archaeon J07HX64]|jgi:hypothetical protein|nr:MAG: hypothetical protein J07HX64_01178 [halophilic archaeon J07HX64]